jgi:MaoC like domain
VRAVERTIVAAMPDPDAPNPNNPIHSTDTARDYGFRAALVGGATIYGWCAATIIDAAGIDWLDRGWANVEFRRPVFPNDELRVRVDADGAFEVRGADERIRIDGRVGLGAAPWAEVIAPRRKPPEPAADPLPALTPANVPVGRELLARRVSLTRAEAEAFCRDKQNESLACFFGADARVHPAWLANQPIYWLHHSFSYGAAIHTASRIEHVHGARVGQDFDVLGRCADAFERKGHRYIVNDVEIVDTADRLVARIRHTAIYQVAKTSGEGT